MKKAILIGSAIALVMTSPALAGWRQVAVNDQGATFSVDENRVLVNRQENLVQFWLRTKFPRVYLGADKIDTQITASCGDASFTRTQAIAYRGRRIVSKGNLNQGLQYAQEGDGHYSAIAEVCNNYE